MLIRNTLRYLPAQIIGPTTQFIAILVFTHWMAPGPYGIFTYVIASQEFVFLLCVAWWSQYTVRYFGEHALNADGAYRESEGMIMAATVLAQIVATMAVLLLLSTPITPALAIASVLYMLTRSFNLHLGERARAQNRFVDYTIAATVGPLVGFVVAFAAVMFVAETPAAPLFGYALVQAISLIWLTLRQDVTFAFRMPDRALLRQALAFGLPLIAAGVAGWCGMNAIRVLVDHQRGAEAMGLIAVGWSLGHRLSSTVATLMTVAAFPLAVERFRVGSHDQAYGEITRNGLMMLGILLPSAVGLYLVRDALIPLLVAGPFQAMTLAVLPAALVAGVARNLRTHVADQIFVLVERTTMVFMMTVMEAGLVIVGCLVGLAAEGAPGAAIGSATGYTIAMVVGLVFARWHAGLRVPLSDAVAVVAATMIMAVIVSVLRGALRGTGGTIVDLALEVVVGAVVYAIAITVVFPAVADYARGRWKRVQPLLSWKKS